MSIVFYSWQSDLPNATNRGFIESALEKAVKSIHRDESIEVQPVIDRDTQRVPGAPDIASTILKKIDESDVFVGDVSLINQETNSVRRILQGAFRLRFRPAPNPNVLVEFGYAIKTMAPNRIILVLNSFFGGPELLPFDLRMKRTLAYHMPPATSERAPERNKLATALEQALRDVFTKVDTILPELSPEDNSIFKTLCEMVVEMGHDSFGRNTLEEMAQRFGPSFDESLRILKLKDYLDGTWTANGKVHNVRVKASGFDLYARQHVKDYRKTVRQVIDKIIEQPRLNSAELRDALGHPHYLIKFILVSLANRNLIKMLGYELSHTVAGITWISPELRRLREW